MFASKDRRLFMEGDRAPELFRPVVESSAADLWGNYFDPPLDRYAEPVELGGSSWPKTSCIAPPEASFRHRDCTEPCARRDRY
jgi:hypothetical protein